MPEAADRRSGPREEARDEEATEEEPIPLGGPDDGRTRRGPRRRAAGGPPRRPRPPRSGEPSRPSFRRVAGLAIAGLVILAVFLLIGPGIDLWTDAIWYRSVGFESFFWTRVGTQFGLFAGVLIAALVVLLGDLWLAGRLAPPPTEGGGSLGSLFDRLNAAARESAERGAGPEGPFGGPWGRGRPPIGPRPISIEREDVPDLTPVAVIVLAGLAIFIALGLAAAASSAWETILLWRNRVPFAATEGQVVDPIFGRDIGFFLFELPFLRLDPGAGSTA